RVLRAKESLMVSPVGEDADCYTGRPNSVCGARTRHALSPTVEVRPSSGLLDGSGREGRGEGAGASLCASIPPSPDPSPPLASSETRPCCTSTAGERGEERQETPHDALPLPLRSARVDNAGVRGAESRHHDDRRSALRCIELRGQQDPE